jgi:hypothetical protein
VKQTQTLENGEHVPDTLLTQYRFSLRGLPTMTQLMCSRRRKKAYHSKKAKSSPDIIRYTRYVVRDSFNKIRKKQGALFKLSFPGCQERTATLGNDIQNAKKITLRTMERDTESPLRRVCVVKDSCRMCTRITC